MASSSSLTTSTSSSSLLVCVFSPDVLSNDDLHNCCSALFLFLFILSHTQSISALKDEFHIQTFQICDSQIMGKTSLFKYATTALPAITTYNTNIQTNINNFFSHLLSTSYDIYPNQKAVSRHSSVRETETERCFVVVAAAVDNAKSFNLRHTKD